MYKRQFHATKLFHTVEGGALVTNDDEVAHRIAYMRNFGHKGQEEFWGLGINGKNSELHAAMGLCLLPRVPQLISARRAISEQYDCLLESTNLARPKRLETTEYNYAYYPVLFVSERDLTECRAALNTYAIYPRRYFFPSLNSFQYVSSCETPVGEEVASRVLCLPLYPQMSHFDVARVCAVISKNNRSAGL